MQKLKLFPMLALAVALLAPSIASAADRNRWVGKDSQGTVWVYRSTDGGSWTEWDSQYKIRLSYKAVDRTADFIELVCDDDLRVRIYDDKVMSWSAKRGRWFNKAEGEWKD